MAKFSTISQHIGRNVYFISGLPFDEKYLVTQYFIKAYDVKDTAELVKEYPIYLESLIEKSGGKYFCLVTANTIQKSIAKSLENLNFKQIVTFYSSHGGAKSSNETLTLWVKTIKEKSEETNKSVVSQGDFTWNCSVYIKLSNEDYRKRFTLTVLDASNDKEFKKIKNMPLSYRLVGSEEL